MISPIQALTGSDLAGLAEAVRSGRVSAPFTSLAVQRYCSEANAETIATELQAMSDGGATQELIARIAEMLADERANRSNADDTTDLVLSGPEVP